MGVIRLWTPERRKIADEMTDQGFLPVQIAERVGLTARQVSHYLWNKSIGGYKPKDETLVALMRERDIRDATPPHDLTSVLMGDPKPGFSQADKRSACHRNI